jgi:transcriptional regulator with XRE-family HTH domain
MVDNFSDSSAFPKRLSIVGSFLKAQRETKKLSQKALGQLFSPPVTTQFISNVERGVTPLPPHHVPTIAKALDVSEREILATLEEEYSMKLTGGVKREPLHFQQGSSEEEYFRKVFNAFLLSDPKVKKDFEQYCESCLNVKRI